MQLDPFTVVIEPDEDAFHAYAPALPGCHTFGATVEEAQANVREAIALHVECMLTDGEGPPSENGPWYTLAVRSSATSTPWCAEELAYCRRSRV